VNKDVAKLANIYCNNCKWKIRELNTLSILKYTTADFLLQL
jgi:hypothetical protein